MVAEEDAIARLGFAEDQTQAAIWRSILEAEGIPCMVKNRGVLAYTQVAYDRQPYDYEVWVPRSALRRARHLLRPSLKKRWSGPRDILGQIPVFWAAFYWLVLLFVGFVTFMSVFRLWPAP